MRSKFWIFAAFLVMHSEALTLSSPSESLAPNATAFANESSGNATSVFQCPSETMVHLPLDLVCNDNDDCPDGSDETEETCLNVKGVCQPGLLKCPGEMLCIEHKAVCDGKRDCASGWDESERAGCPARHMFRNNRTGLCPRNYSPCEQPFHRCIPNEAKCDFNWDCQGGEDENDCVDGRACPHGLFNCRTTPDRENVFYFHCIEYSIVCNNVSDCPNGDDETPSACAQYEAHLVAKKAADDAAAPPFSFHATTLAAVCLLLKHAFAS